MELKQPDLLIDDDKKEYELLCIALETYGKNISCTPYCDWAASYEAVKEEHFDCIFLGFECLKKI